MSVTGWKLDRVEREHLLERFTPVWPDVIADHVTLMSSQLPRKALPDANQGMIVGHVNDGVGLQALVVEIGNTTTRPDGSTYHITWSINSERGRKPKDSNEVLARMGWKPLTKPLPIRLIPASWS